MTGEIVILGNTETTWFPPQFTGSIDGRSLIVTPIEYYDHSGSLLKDLHATGFFYRHEGEVYFVSARHALTGLDAFSNRAFSKSGYLPQRVRVFPGLKKEESNFRINLDVEVRTPDGEPLWLQDPEFAELNTDIACIRIDHQHKDLFWSIEPSQDENLFSAVGFDCFIAGYPNRNYRDPYLPIWRRGSFAYEPSVPVHDRPMFLVDAATSPGLSGSPIFQRAHGPAPIVGESGELVVKGDAVVSTRFVGVYGGRLDHTNQLAQVGYGWYANRIPMIVSGVAKHRPGKPVEFKLETGIFSFGGDHFSSAT